MKVKLTEQGLEVNKYSCRSVTIYKKGENDYEAYLHNIKGITKRIPAMSYGKQKVRWDGSKIFKILKMSKTIKSKIFYYNGIPLKKSFSHKENEDYYHAKNDKGNYINYYEQSPTSQTKSLRDFPNGEHNNNSSRY